MGCFHLILKIKIQQFNENYSKVNDLKQNTFI